MDSNIKISKDKLDALLNMASNGLGVSPEKLRQGLQSGELSSVVPNMSGKKLEEMNNILSNPAKLNEILNNPKMRALMERLKD